MADSTNEQQIARLTNEFLPRLPDDILLKVVNYLNFDYITEFVLQHPQIRKVVIEEYFAKEVHFVISPTRRPYVTTLSPFRRKYVTFKSSFEITQFLEDHPDINAAKILLVSGGDFQSMREILERFGSRFTEHGSLLDITLDDIQMQPRDMEFLLSFPNLYRLHLSGVDLSHVKKYLSSSQAFISHPGLQQLIILGHSWNKWSAITFPPNIRHLDVSWNTYTDPTTINLQESIRELYLNNCGATSSSLLEIKWPTSLQTLMLTYNSIDNFDVSILPQSLEIIDLSHNKIQSFETSAVAWPPHLKTISLSNNHIGDAGINQLASVQWPSTLTGLSLENNNFSDVSFLQSLPASLVFLDLSFTEISSLVDKVSTEYIEFPPSLQYLRLSGCAKLKFVNKQARFKFPPCLYELDMTSSTFKLSDLVFPSSICKLALSGCEIDDLGAYEDSGANEPVLWSQLENLVDLDLFGNHIMSLDNWVPPKAIRELNLSRNLLMEIGPSAPTFNQEYAYLTDSLRSLNLQSCGIRRIDQNIYIPQYVESIQLGGNTLGDLVIPASLGTHRSLSYLDLSSSKITSIGFSTKGSASKLCTLDLSNNYIMKQNGRTPREALGPFYDALEAGFGVKVHTRKFHINGIHKF